MVVNRIRILSTPPKRSEEYDYERKKELAHNLYECSRIFLGSVVIAGFSPLITGGEFGLVHVAAVSVGAVTTFVLAISANNLLKKKED